jgi:glutaredoxin-related protein
VNIAQDVCPEILSSDAKSSRNFVNYDFQNIDLNLKTTSESYEKFGQNIQQLSLYECNVSSENLEEYLKMSPNVTTLDFMNMSRDVTKGWLHEIRCDSEAMKIIASMTNLQELKLYPPYSYEHDPDPDLKEIEVLSKLKVSISGWL